MVDVHATSIPMKHDPLGDGDNAVLRLAERGQLGLHSIVRVCHDAYWTSLRVEQLQTLYRRYSRTHVRSVVIAGRCWCWWKLDLLHARAARAIYGKSSIVLA